MFGLNSPQALDRLVICRKTAPEIPLRTLCSPVARPRDGHVCQD